MFRISIHAPREGCDCRAWRCRSPQNYFNPRTPRGVRRSLICPPGARCTEFQSTHPARGATSPRDSYPCPHPYFNPRTPRGVRRRFLLCSLPCCGNFNPRTPRGVRPLRGWRLPPVRRISIHAPREGCDGQGTGYGPAAGDFNPRTPRGVRPECTSAR